ncbi:adenylate kinase [Thalassobaculum sp.]|uniref:adenylate kinase n=1 Tax=Thalassobaculum sp. TaxID=2022740 RepID=UPI0032EC9DA3
MHTRRIHILGASGSGTTTLGRTLACEMAVPHHDTDDYFWLPTEPPFTEKRPEVDRLRLMSELFTPRAAWVLSGSLVGWGDPLIPLFDLVVFLHTPARTRLARLRNREAVRYGQAAIAPGGSHHDATEGFLNWAAGYDGGNQGRTLRRHEEWLAGLPCPVVRLDGSRPLLQLVASLLAAADGAAFGDSPGSGC